LSLSLSTLFYYLRGGEGRKEGKGKLGGGVDLSQICDRPLPLSAASCQTKVVITLNKSQTNEETKTVTVFFPSHTVLTVFVAKKSDFVRQINIKK
jgi:hypothetical protein